MKPAAYRVILFRAGAETLARGCSTRERAEAEFIGAVERAKRMAAQHRVPYRVELWAGEALIDHVDVPAGAYYPQPRA